MTRFRLIASALILSPCTAFAWGSGCVETAPRELDLDAAGVSVLQLAARAGELRIEGDAAQTRILVRGTACASDADLLAQIQLVTTRDGARQSVEVQMPEMRGWGNKQASLDLVVRVPARLHLEVSDTSGDAEVSGVAALDAQDSSGDFDVREIAGDVTLRDSSGDLDVRNVGGRVLVRNDSSGDISIRDVQGDATIEKDTSGGIQFADVRGNATVDSDSSGEIEFDRIGGSAIVGSDSSGSIRANDVARDFIVRQDGSGDIDHRDVRGQVSVPRR
jgi:hypothetical protein